MKYVIRAGMAATAWAALAFPALSDGPSRAPVPVYRAPPPIYRAPPPPAIIATWTGCYVGLDIGGGWVQASASDPVTGANLGNVSAAGVVGGGQVGCDYQAGLLVFGIQGMANAADIKGSRLQPIGGATNVLNVPWIETLTARFGISVQPTTLLYLKGGGAWVRDNFSVTAGGATIANGIVTPGGWTIGGGFEFRFAPNWSVFIEYDYLGFGSRQVALATPVGIGLPVNFDHNVQQLLVGVNFRFGGPFAPFY